MIKNLRRECSHIVSLIVAFFILSMLSTFAKPALSTPSQDDIATYKKNLMPEHRLKLAYEIQRFHDADNIWDVLRDEFSMPHYEDNPIVQGKIEWYLNNQIYLMRSASRAGPYLYFILQQVRKRHLPAEIVLLPIIESGYDPFSMSNVGAAGIWQLMPDTATGFGIKHDWWYDGRRDIIASTNAALNYLLYLQNFFDGNWLLAIAAYNTGEGNVLAAIKRNVRNGKGTEFWSLGVAQQTRDYVPSLLALATIISRPDRYPLILPPVKNAPYLAQVDVGSQINLKYAASLAGMSYRSLMRLNPGFNRTSTSAKGPYKLILPIEKIMRFAENLIKNPIKYQKEWVKYKVQTGDSLIAIAKKFNVSVVALRRMNELKSHLLHPGNLLMVPNHEQKPTSPLESIEKFNVKQKSNFPLPNNYRSPDQKAGVFHALRQKYINQIMRRAKYRLAPGDTLYMVRNKDTLFSIAKKFHIDYSLLRAVNQMHTSKLKIGEQLIIPTHLSKASKLVSRAPQRNIIPGDTLYMVRNGDTIEKIALKFHTTPSAIRISNLIDNNSLVVGEKIVVPTHLRG